ncbi:MAG: hypothetical protein Q8S10_05320 [Thiobacillus sp.]|nr:hypothetical protein [Thiobacillus sp.]
MEHREYDYRFRANPEINAVRKAPHNRLANAIEHREKSTTKAWLLPFIPVGC